MWISKASFVANNWSHIWQCSLRPLSSGCCERICFLRFRLSENFLLHCLHLNCSFSIECDSSWDTNDAVKWTKVSRTVTWFEGILVSNFREIEFFFCSNNQNLQACLNFFEHMVQLNGNWSGSLTCVIPWRRRLLLSLNALPHCSQVNGLSPVCKRLCVTNVPTTR